MKPIGIKLTCPVHGISIVPLTKKSAAATWLHDVSRAILHGRFTAGTSPAYILFKRMQCKPTGKTLCGCCASICTVDIDNFWVGGIDDSFFDSVREASKLGGWDAVRDLLPDDNDFWRGPATAADALRGIQAAIDMLAWKDAAIAAYALGGAQAVADMLGASLKTIEIKLRCEDHGAYIAQLDGLSGPTWRAAMHHQTEYTLVVARLWAQGLISCPCDDCGEEPYAVLRDFWQGTAALAYDRGGLEAIIKLLDCC